MGIVSGYYTGKDGRLSTGPDQAGLAETAKVTSWSLDGAVDVLETTHLGAYERSYVPGLKSATGSASVLYYEPENKGPTDCSNVASILSKIITGTDLTEANARLYFQLLWNDGVTNPGRDRRALEFYGFITQASMAMQTGAVLQVNLSFQMSGDYAVADL